jgi:phosphoribulokinase
MNSAIAICGDSGSGKTTMSLFLCQQLKNCTILECDRYHKWERGDYHWRYFTQLDPSANEIDLMKSDVKRLKDGFSIQRKDYDHSKGKFTEPKLIEPNEHILVVGLHSIKADVDLKIFIDTQKDLKYLWKINRDFKERGHSIEAIIENIKNREVDFQNYILPQKRRADIIVTHFWDKKQKQRIEIVKENTLSKRIARILNEQVHTD